MDWLTDKYINLISGSLRNFRKKSNSLYNFSCPYCGDSRVNKYKARGYIYEKEGEYLYTCHNCNISKNMNSFLRDQDYNVYAKYRFEKFGNKKKYTETDIEKLFTQNTKTRLQDFSVRVTNLSDSHSVNRYLEARKIPKERRKDFFFTNNLTALVPLFPKYAETTFRDEPRLILPCYNQNNVLIGVICRDIRPDAKLRYVVMKVEWWPHIIYGLEHVDLSKHVYVTEGPIDSLFLPNSLAMGSMDSDYAYSICKKESTVFCFDNTPRNKELLRHLKSSLNDGWKVCIWPENLEHKDINEMILAGMSIEDVKYIIDKNTYSGLTGLTKLASWRKINAD